MKNFSIFLIILCYYSIAYTQNSSNNSNDYPIVFKGNKHCPCWTLMPGTCKTPGFICMDFGKSFAPPSDIDFVHVDLENLKATFKVYIDNYNELELIINNGIVVNDYDYSYIDDDLIKHFYPNNIDKYLINKGNYNYELIGNYYVLIVNIHKE